MPTEQSRQEEVSLPHKLITDGFDEYLYANQNYNVSTGNPFSSTNIEDALGAMGIAVWAMTEITQLMNRCSRVA